MVQRTYSEVLTARRVIARHNPDYPLDIFAFAKRFIHVTTIQMPTGIDGFLRYRNHEQPTAFLNAVTSPQRQAFTLAHELGHYFIPWHPRATMPCNTDAEYFYIAIEKQANRFASELLMPEIWISQSLKKHGFEHTIKSVLDAKISVKAACIGLKNTDQPICIMLEDKRTNQREFFHSTACLKLFGAKLSDSPPTDFIASEETVKLENATLHYYSLSTSIASSDNRIDLSAKQLFLALFPAYDPTVEAKWRSANGTISALNGQHKTLPLDKLFGLALARLYCHEKLAEISQTNGFKDFVYKRCTELFSARSR